MRYSRPSSSTEEGLMLRAKIGGAVVLALVCAVAWPSAQGGGGRRCSHEAPERNVDAHAAGRRQAVGLGDPRLHAESQTEALQHGQGEAAVGAAGVQPHAKPVQPRTVLPDGAALRFHLVRDAALAAPIRRGREDDACVPGCRRHADDSHARRAGSQHAEGIRPRHPRYHRADGR